MSKNAKTAEQIGKKTVGITTKMLTSCALLAALGVVLARLIVPMPNEFTRFSIEAVPTVLAGLLFGPVAGALVGFTADFVGCLFSPYPYNVIFCIPPILYGLSAGLLRRLPMKKVSVYSLAAVMAPAVVFGSILYQSWALDFMYGKGFWFLLSTRTVQFAVTMVVDVVILYLLFKSKIFQQMGFWPLRSQKQS